MAALNRWFFGPVPLARIAIFRIAAYLFIPLDLLVLRPLGAHHASATALYQPLVVAELLHLPRPTPTLIAVVTWTLIPLALTAAALAPSGRWQRVLGTAIFLLYFEQLIISFSFGKVDHDRIAYLVALAVLPTVAGARLRSEETAESAAWALRCVQIAVVATYFLSVFAKLRFGGIEWVNSATLVRAVMRRGTGVGRLLLDYPWMLHWAQWGIVIMELGSPVILFLRGRWRYVAVGVLAAFHLTVYVVISIMFWPHVLCLLFAFLPTERLVRRDAEKAPHAVAETADATPGAEAAESAAPAPVGGQGARRSAAGEAVPVGGDEPVHAVGQPPEGRNAQDEPQR
ncbi:Vitamin K-dependent gamma-carboxylase [Thermostaphylospora chromogena]|uniref:Vitamin K-dependent gamma-carboxylase n=1 Tax=Thermostaphylospora chromogena TaxID=35622 RepID=A0A1H1CP41_9ACTN|nr:Vitamin K-dependent gamma-carboxylase [Thermostaphylospora chromogena]